MQEDYVTEELGPVRREGIGRFDGDGGRSTYIDKYRRWDMLGGPPDDVLSGRLRGRSGPRDRNRPFCRLGLSLGLRGGLLRQGERDGLRTCLGRRGCLCGCVCRPLHNHPSKHQRLGARGDGRGDGRKGEG
jgi:hypothetical protein